MSSAVEAEQPQVAAPAASTWKPEVVEELMLKESFAEVACALEDALTVRRNPQAVNWCVEWGYRRGHVLPLWFLTWNQLRFSLGRVPSVEDLEFGVRCAALLLLRGAQDCVSCRLDMAKCDRVFILNKLALNVHTWLSKWVMAAPSALPTGSAIAVLLTAWLECHKSGSLPLPTWATSLFPTNMLSAIVWNERTAFWRAPDAHDVASFQRSLTVVDTRAKVAAAFLAELAATTTPVDWLKFAARYMDMDADNHLVEVLV